jgi:hypothetical protein
MAAAEAGIMKRTKNLDVAGTSRDSKFGCTKGIQGDLAPGPYLSSLCASAVHPDQQQRHRRRYSPGGTKITVLQATNIIEAVSLAKLIGLPLVAHLSIHWSLTDVGDDANGKLFARFREGLNKWFNRRGIVFAAAWARERQARGQSDVEHCHLLFHLPVEYRTGKKLLEVEDAMSRLVERHGRGILHKKAIDLRVHDNPDGKYLIKGGGRKIWKRIRLRKEHRRLQGIIHGKRCGTTQNIGQAARRQARLLRCRPDDKRQVPSHRDDEKHSNEWSSLLKPE